MAEPVGALRAELSANAARFEADMGKARRSVRTSSQSMKRGFRGVEGSVKSLLTRMGGFRAVIGAVAGTAGLGLLFRNALKTGDAIAKTARAIGISTDALQELRFAASQSGISLESFDSGLAGFSKRVGEARSETGTLVTLLKRLDPELLRNLKAAKGVDEAFGLVVTSSQKMGNTLDRNALLAAAFGRTLGVSMVNLVEGGIQKIDELRKTARDLGIVLSEDLLLNAETTTDELDKLGRVISVRVNAALLELAPLITQVSTAMIDAILQTGRWVLEWQKLNKEIAKSGAIVGFEGIMGLDEPGLVPGGVDLGAEKRVKALQEQTKAALVLKGAEDLAGEARVLALKELDLIQEKVNARGKQLFAETRTEAERYTIQIQELNRLYREEGVISLDTYNRALKKIKESMNEVQQESLLAQQIGAAFTFQLSSGLADAIVEADNFKDAMKNLAVQIARMVLQMLIFRALTAGFGGLFSFGGGGGGSAPAIGQFAEISLQKGGQVPGPIGRPLLAIVHGGEMVTPATGDQFRGGQNITVQNQFFPGLRETIRAEIFTLLPVISDHTTLAVITARGRGGKMARAMGQRG